MAGLQGQDVSRRQRGLSWQAPTLALAGVAVAAGLVAALLTVVRAAGEATPDEAAARAFAEVAAWLVSLVLVSRTLPVMTIKASGWYMGSVLNPRIDRELERAESLLGHEVAETPSRVPWWASRWFNRVTLLVTFATWSVAVLFLAVVLSRALLAASGSVAYEAPASALVACGAAALLGFAMYQVPLVIGTWQLRRLNRVMDELERMISGTVPSPGAGGPPASEAYWATRVDRLIEPFLRRFGPLSLPGWRRPQPGTP